LTPEEAEMDYPVIGRRKIAAQTGVEKYFRRKCKCNIDNFSNKLLLPNDLRLLSDKKFLIIIYSWAVNTPWR
jgi:hypothetical protein